MNAWEHFAKDLAVGSLWSAPAVIGSVRAAKNEGKDPLMAGVKSIVSNNWMNIAFAGSKLPGWGMFAYPILTSLGAGYTAGRAFVGGHNITMRRTATPFSNSFEHSDVTYAAQQRGMATINGYRSMLGNEAAALAQRYSRR
jgi:hypothetical protein